MITGILAINITFVVIIISAVAYGLYYKYKDARLLHLGNNFFFLSGVLILFSLGLMLYSIMTHNFQLNYVYSYSSRSLNKFYLFSTLWAGQEGTFMLWLLYGSIYGLILIRTVAKKQPLVMLFLVLVQAYILLILLEKNPFAAIWHVHPEAPFGFTPRDGSGLNPLLQNPWMVIHPPTLFVGYSSTVVPFAFALNAMVTKNFLGWIRDAKPWVIFSVMILITGIVMGGYWAYATLGWGGYWAWDPVENASLVPWLFSVALLHGIIIQNRRKTLVRTNLILAGAAFISVLWGSYLTRSGVLTDFSVHSFAASGLSLYLLLFVVIFTLFYLFMFFKSTHSLETPRFSSAILNRESFILFGMATFILLALIVLIGTASPLYTGFFSEPASVKAGFYNITSLPIASLMLLAVALAPLLAWKVPEFRDKKIIIISLISAFFTTMIAVLLGLSETYSIILFFLSVFAIIINSVVSYRILRRNVSKAGGYIAHVGLGLMVIGIITSSVYDKSEKVLLPSGNFKQTHLGYEIKFMGFIEKPDGKDEAKLIVKTDHGTYEAYPKFYFSEFNQAYMATPDVKSQFLKDIYISPVSYQSGKQDNSFPVVLSKGERQTVGNLEIAFNRFIVDMGGGTPLVTADLLVTLPEGGYRTEYSAQPTMTSKNGKMTGEPVEVGDTGYRISITRVSAGEGKVWLEISSPQTDAEGDPDIFVVELSEKPLIGILWFGTLLLAGGALLSLSSHVRQRRKEAV